MDEFFDVKVSLDVMDAMVTATGVCIELFEPQISALDFIIAALDFPETKLCEYLEEIKDNGHQYTDTLLSCIITDKSKYELLTGCEYETYLDYKKGSTYNAVIKDKTGKEILNLDINSISSNYYLDYSDELEDAVFRAQDLAHSNNQDCISLDLLIYCILENKASKANQLLKMFYDTKGLMPYLKKNLHLNKSKNKKEIPPEMREYLTDLNSKYTKDSQCDILGRDDEIFQVWNIFSKKTKRNALLIGQPGVGKTAIVEAITYSIVKKKCPKEFRKYTVYSLDLNTMVAGTKYRGEFEERVSDFIKFVENTENVIIFIDEIHQLIGTGSAEGSGPDLSGSLKPILARDNAIFIGSTTEDEYNRIFARDGALSRRFETVLVKEPRFNQVKPMLKAKVNTLSKYHGISIDDKMIDNVIITASSFSNIANPDRTIDLIDKSMAIAKLMGDSELKINHVNMVYKKNYEMLDKIPMSMKKSTAFHEAGHFVAWLLSKTKSNQKCILVSIVPTDYWSGVTMFEDEEVSKHRGDMNFLKEAVSIDLAGRIAQKLVTEEIDSGASSDLQHAISRVETFIMEYGIEKEFINYTFNGRKRDLKISSNISDKIRKKTKEIVDKVYEETETLIQKNAEGIERVANLLLKKKIITCQEAEKAFYNKNAKAKRTPRNRDLIEAK